MNTQFNYKMSLNTYRKMVYFNMFYANRVKNIIIVLVWMIMTVFLVLDIMGIITPTRIMHLSFLMVSLSMPVLIISLEMKIRQIKDNEYFNRKRTVVFSDDGMDFFLDSNTKKRMHNSWDDVYLLYETNSLFIIFKDKINSIPVEKKGTEKGEVNNVREELIKRLGPRYIFAKWI